MHRVDRAREAICATLVMSVLLNSAFCGHNADGGIPVGGGTENVAAFQNDIHAVFLIAMEPAQEIVPGAFVMSLHFEASYSTEKCDAPAPAARLHQNNFVHSAKSSGV
jgi:hypothetical protein